MFSLSEENYLKSIFHLEQKNPAGVSTNALAEQLETKASSVTDMLKKLSDKKLVIYRKYQGVKLSKSGREIALSVIRKHRLWEVFLVEKLEFNWDEVHEVAEQLEHIRSEKLIRELDRFLDFPKRDPHGDPIPDSKGNLAVSDKVILSELLKGESGVCVGVKDSSAEFLQYLDKNSISLGKKITVKEKEIFDGSLTIIIGGKELNISRAVAQNLLLKSS